jgi:acyl CoA:acetate/3-ketoacid CoA transferase beta subunit
VRLVIALMSHTTKDGQPKLLARCTLPITAERPADWIVTELATFRLAGGGLELVELAPGVSLEAVRASTGARFEVRL